MNEQREADIAAAAKMAATEARRDRARAPAQPPPRSPAKARAVLTVSLLLFVATTAANLLGWNPFAVRIPRQTAEQEAESRSEALALKSEWGEGYREENGRLPVDANGAGGPWEVHNVDDVHYEVVLIDGDEQIVYSSRDPYAEPLAANYGGSSR